MTLRRLEDWDVRLDAEIRARAARPFDHGPEGTAGHDCCKAVLACLAVQAGRPLVAASVLRYRTARGAAGRLAREGGLAAFARRLAREAGLLEVAAMKAGRGCPVLIETGDAAAPEALGVVDLTGRRALAAAEIGWSARPLGDPSIVAAWRFD